MVRALVIATLLAACAKSSHAPAWPKPSAKTTDGGESLAPRRASPMAVADVPANDIVVIEPVAEKPITKAPVIDMTVVPIRPATPAVTSPDIIIRIDDIIIDLDD